MYEVLEKLMREYNIRPHHIAKATGISSSVFTDWKKGRYVPKVDKLEKIADFFGLPVQVFFSDISELPNFMKQQDKEKLHESNQKVNEIEGLAPLTPIYEVACGEGRVNYNYASEYDTMDDMTNAEESSWCIVRGDSMAPTLREGDKVRIIATTAVTSKDYALVKINGNEATIKFVDIVENGLWLRAENPEVYPDRFFSVMEVMTLPVTIVGKAVEVRRSL